MGNDTDTRVRLVVDDAFTGTLADFRTKINEIPGQFSTVSGSITSAAGLVKAAVGTMLAGFSVGAITGMVGGLVSDLGSLKDASEKAGSSIEGMAGLVTAAAKSGHSLTDVVSLTSALERGMVGAEQGTGRTALALKALGLESVTAIGDTANQIKAIADRLGDYEDGASKTQFAIMLFGKAGADAIPILNDLAEAGKLPELGRGFTDGVIAADSLEKSLAALKREADLGKQQLIAEFVPAWAATAQEFREARDAGFGLVDALLLVSGNTKQQQISKQADVVNDLRTKLDEGASAVRKFFDPGVEERMQAQYDQELKRLNALNDQALAEEKRGSQVRKSKEELAALIKGIQDEEDRVRKEADARKRAEEAARRLNAVQSDAIGINADYSQKVRDLETLFKGGRITQDEYTGAVKRLGEAQPVVKQYTSDQEKASKALEDQQKKERDTLKELAGLYESSQKPIADQTKEVDALIQKQIEENEKIGLTKGALADLTAKRWDDKAALVQLQIDEANQNGALGSEYQKLVDLKNKYIELAGEVRKGDRAQAVADEAKAIESTYNETAKTIEKSLTDALLRGFESGKGVVQNLVTTIKNLFNTLVLRPIINAVVNPIAGTVTSALGLGSSAATAATAANGAGAAGGLLNLGGALSGVGGGFAAGAGWLFSSGATLMGNLSAAGSLIATGSGAGIGAGLAMGAGALAPIALGVLALSSLLGKPGGPKLGGTFDSIGLSERLYTPNSADEQLSTLGKGVLESVGKLAGELGGTGASLKLALGFDQDPKGTASSRISSRLVDSSGQVLFDNAARDVGRDEAVFGAELNNETARLLLKGLQASTLPDKVGEYLSQFVAENMSAADIGTAIEGARGLVPKTEAQNALDTALQDTGTQVAVSTEVRELNTTTTSALAVQRDILAAAEAAQKTRLEQLEVLHSQVVQLAEFGRTLLQRISDGVSEIGGVRSSIDMWRNAPTPVMGR